MSRNGITFIARFGDGEIVRMSVHTEANNLDLVRAKHLAIAAYENRTRRRRREKDIADRKARRSLLDEAWPTDAIPVEVPPIIEVTFVNANGTVQQTYRTADELAA